MARVFRFEPTETVSLDDELERIATMLHVSRNGGFALLSYDRADQLDAWLAAIGARLDDAAFVHVPVPQSGVKIATEIDKLATQGATSALTVFVIAGIEQLEPEARTLLITNLNRMRTHLAGVAHPLLFCGDDSVLGVIVHEAPDLFDRIGLWADLRGFTPPTVAPAPTLSPEQQYREALVRRLRLVEFRGILSINKPVTLPLTEFYVPLQAEQQNVTERLPDRFRIEFLRQEYPDKLPPEPRYENRVETRLLGVSDAVNKYRTLMVLGDPGAGKSTLIRYLALAAAENQPERAGLPSHENAWLPILVSCASYSAALEDSSQIRLIDYIANTLSEQFDVPEALSFLRNALLRRRVLLLFDGLDEVQPKHRGRIASDIETFVGAWCRTISNGNLAVVSSRVVGYTTHPVETDTTIQLRDFEQPQIEQFLKNWCVAYEQFARGDVPEARADGEKQAGQLAAEISSNAGARRLAGNPLLLTIMALIQRQGVRMPERRVELYDIASRTLIETWNRARGLSETILLSLPDTRLTFALLGDLALWMQERGITAATTDELLPVLAESERKRGANEPDAAAAAFLHDVQHYSGLLAERGPDNYSFLHLTFQEYFAARALAAISNADERWARIRPHLHDPRWRETILLTAGELGVRIGREDEVSDLVQRILDATPAPSKLTMALFQGRLWWLLRDRQIDQIEEHYLQRHVLLAGQILADDPGVEFQVGQHVTRALLQLLDNRIIPLCDTAAALLKRLPTAFREHAAATLCASLIDQNQDVQRRRRAADALRQLGIASPAILDTLLVAFHDQDANVRVAATYALGQLGRASSVVTDSLLVDLQHQGQQVLGNVNRTVIDTLQAARNDPGADVRRNAAIALGQLGHVSAAVIDALSIALHDENKNVRECAATALGRLGRANLGTVDLLSAALQDQDSNVRRSAVAALGQMSNPNPAVIAALSAALQDQDTQIEAAHSLRKLGDANPTVIAVLTVALHAQSLYMRLAAAAALERLGHANPAALDLLTTELHSSNKSAIWSAADMLGQLGNTNSAAVDVLSAALTNKDEDVRRSATHALGQLGQASPTVIDVLTTALTDKDEDVRRSAAHALGQLGQAKPNVVSMLSADLHDRNPYVITSAAITLTKLHVASQVVRLSLLKGLIRPGPFKHLTQLSYRDQIYTLLTGNDEAGEGTEA